jgi:hypothetical protein
MIRLPVSRLAYEQAVARAERAETLADRLLEEALSMGRVAAGLPERTRERRGLPPEIAAEIARWGPESRADLTEQALRAMAKGIPEDAILAMLRAYESEE